MTQKILITGHKGFIGGHLWNWLVESDCYGEWQNERLEIDGIDLKDGNCIGDFKTDKIYDMCEKVGMDYGNVVEGVTADRRIGTSHTKVPGIDGDRCFVGTCYPKDINSLHVQLEN